MVAGDRGPMSAALGLVHRPGSSVAGFIISGLSLSAGSAWHSGQADEDRGTCTRRGISGTLLADGESPLTWTPDLFLRPR